LFFSRTFLWLLAAFIVLGFPETGEPPRKAMIVDLAPGKKRGESVQIYIHPARPGGDASSDTRWDYMGD